LNRIEDEFRKSIADYSKDNIEMEIRAGRHDSDEPVKISLGSLKPLPRCSKCGAKVIDHKKVCAECGERFGQK
jgi:hypothetical protein